MFATIAVAVVSFVYSAVQATKARAKAKRAQREAEARADAAKGFQFVEEGEAKIVPVTFGRAKVGGTRVAFHVAGNFVANTSFLSVTRNTTTMPWEEVGWTSGEPAITQSAITKVAVFGDRWDTAVASGEALFPGSVMTFQMVAKAPLRIGFTKDQSANFYNWECYFNFTSTEVTYGPGIPPEPYAITDTFTLEYSSQKKLRLLKNGIEKRVIPCTTPMFIRVNIFKQLTGINNLYVSAIVDATDTHTAFSKAEGEEVDAYLLTNSAPDWSGTWTITPASNGVTGIKYVTRVMTTWANFPMEYASSGYGSPGQQLVAPSVDYVAWSQKKWLRKETVYEPNPYGGPPVAVEVDVYDQEAIPPKLSELGLEFPAYKPGSQDNLAENVSPNEPKNEFLFIQQVIGFGGITTVVAAEVNDLPATSPEFGHGLKLKYFRKGGVDPWMASNDPSRSEALFEGVAYFTGAFKLNRDEPQFNGTPDVQSFVEGQACLRPVFDRATNKFTRASGRAYSNNPARVLLTYLMDTAYGVGLPSSVIDFESFYYATLTCDRMVVEDAPQEGPFWDNKSGRRHVKLFECNITLDTGQPFRENIEKILETMYMADLIWSGGKYKLQFQYPRVYSETEYYQQFELVQTLEGDLPTFYRAKHNGVYGKTPATHPDDWLREPVFEIDDDILLYGEPIQEDWPDLENKLNFATVRYLNEDIGFKEDVVSWPEKEPTDVTDTLYADMLAADNNRRLEADYFASGVTTIYHARALAEQRVRASRSMIDYTFKTTLACFALEPGDLIILSSVVHGIAKTVCKVTSLEFEGDGIVQVSVSTFDARMLSWNISDTAAYVPPNPYQFRGLSQARNPALVTGIGNNRLSFYKIMWTAADDVRVSKYRIKYTDIPITGLNSNTIWTDLGETTSTEFDLPPLQGTFTFAVVSVSRDGVQAPRHNPEAGSTWPVLSAELTARHLYATSMIVSITGGNIFKADSSLLALTAELTAADANDMLDLLEYRWTDVTDPPGEQLSQLTPGYASKYGYRTLAASQAAANPALSELGVGLPATPVFSDNGRTIVVSSDAIIGKGTLMVEVRDKASEQVYKGYVNITDLSEPYQIRLASSSGDRFINDSGEKDIWPIVIYGGTTITNLQGWAFKYTMQTYNGQPGGFIDWSRSPPNGHTVSNNTAYSSTTFFLDVSTTIVVSANDRIKVIKPDKTIRYFEVNVSATSTRITLRNTALFPATDVTAGDFVGSAVFICTGNGATAGEVLINGLADTSKVTSTDFKLAVKAKDVDYMSHISVMAYQPTIAEKQAAGI